MNYHLHNNGWTVIVDDFDLSTATQDDINHIARLLSTNTLVVVPKQSLTIEDEVRVIKMFKNPEQQFISSDEDFRRCSIAETGGLLSRVTGELNEYGEKGLAGDVSALDWHCNHPGETWRRSIVWLYAAKGSAGSRTSWNNNMLSYNDLDQASKDKLSKLKCIFGSTIDKEVHFFGKEREIRLNNTPKLVQTNIAGKTGLFFPFLQLVRFKDMSDEESQEIIKPLAKHTTQEKYLYHHIWQDGDVVISEQWLGIHKRWAFDGMPTRLLHRAAFDFPDQDYK